MLVFKNYCAIPWHLTLSIICKGIPLFLAPLLLYLSYLYYDLRGLGTFAVIMYIIAIGLCIPEYQKALREKKCILFLIILTCVVSIAVTMAVVITVIIWLYNLPF